MGNSRLEEWGQPENETIVVDGIADIISISWKIKVFLNDFQLFRGKIMQMTCGLFCLKEEKKCYTTYKLMFYRKNKFLCVVNG